MFSENFCPKPAAIPLAVHICAGKSDYDGSAARYRPRRCHVVTADIVNLRRARKTRDRARKEAEAEANRAKFGRTRSERSMEKAERDQLTRHLDGTRLVPTHPAAGDAGSDRPDIKPPAAEETP